MVGGAQDRLLQMAEELGRMKCELAGKSAALGLGEGEDPITPAEARELPESEMTRDRFVRVVDYRNTHESISRHEWVMFIVREELSRFREGMRGQSKGGGKGLGGGRTKELNH